MDDLEAKDDCEGEANLLEQKGVYWADLTQDFLINLTLFGLRLHLWSSFERIKPSNFTLSSEMTCALQSNDYGLTFYKAAQRILIFLKYKRFYKFIN